MVNACSKRSNPSGYRFGDICRDIFNSGVSVGKPRDVLDTSGGASLANARNLCIIIKFPGKPTRIPIMSEENFRVVSEVLEVKFFTDSALIEFVCSRSTPKPAASLRGPLRSSAKFSKKPQVSY